MLPQRGKPLKHPVLKAKAARFSASLEPEPIRTEALATEAMEPVHGVTSTFSHPLQYFAST
jgi:hypothetical protein